MSKRKSNVIFIGLFTSFLMLHSSAFGVTMNDEGARSSLKGLKGVYVWVDFATDAFEDLKEKGLSKEVIKTDIELKLRMAGINVVSKKDIYNIPGIPQLVVSIAGIISDITGDTQGKGIAFIIDIQLLQSADLSRDPKLRVLSSTWSRSSMGVVYTDNDIISFIGNAVKNLIDSFINAYLSVNPKGGN